MDDTEVTPPNPSSFWQYAKKPLCHTTAAKLSKRSPRSFRWISYKKNSELMYAGGILSFYFIWFNPIRMSFQLCFILKCKENTEVIPKMDWKWPMPKMSEKLTDAGTIADPSSFHWEQHGGKWWPPPNEKLTRKSRSINQRDKSFLIRNSKKCPLLKNFVILLWLLDSKHFGQAIDIPFSNCRSCQQEANYMLALENCKEAESVIPMQLLVQVEL